MSDDNAARRYRARVGGTLALIAVAAGLGVATTAPSAAADQPGGSPCLWAGTAYPTGHTVYAGGSAFTCATDGAAARWDRHSAPGHPDSVPNPGATQNGAAGFSVGAWQPGTSFFDFCAEDALIPGTDYVFEAVPHDGGVFWNSAGPISQWAFAANQQATYTRAPQHLCVNNVRR